MCVTLGSGMNTATRQQYNKIWITRKHRKWQHIAWFHSRFVIQHLCVQQHTPLTVIYINRTFPVLLFLIASGWIILMASIATKTEKVLRVNPVILQMYPTDGGDGRNMRMLSNKRIYDARMCPTTVHYLIQLEYTTKMNVKIYYNGRKTLHKTF